MRATLWVTSILACYITTIRTDLRVLKSCHYDPDPPPGDGVLPRDLFPWMAVLEYLHLETGSRYPSRVPRVSLIHQHFGLTTASVATSAIPEGYSLGNVVIVEYVRDEETCGLTLEQVMQGSECPRASYVIPVADVILHPEYTNFGAPESLALLKLMLPVESRYLLPICLPIGAVWTYDMRPETVYLLDFLSVAPVNYEYEAKGLKRLHILPPNVCDSFQLSLNTSGSWRQRMLCTTGCGMRAGAPLAAHDQRMRVGYYWHLVGVAVGGPPCEGSAARHRRNKAPPRFVYVWPYVDWIVQILMSHDAPFPVPLAQHRRIPFDDTAVLKHWEARWYLEGTHCHYNKWSSAPRFIFYEDYLSVRTIKKSWLRFYLNLRNEVNYTIVCIKILMPTTFLTPDIYFDSLSANVSIPLVRFPRRYDLRVQAWGHAAELQEIIDRNENLTRMREEIYENTMT